MTITARQFYIIDSLSLDVSLECNAKLVVAWLYSAKSRNQNTIWMDKNNEVTCLSSLLGDFMLTNLVFQGSSWDNMGMISYSKVCSCMYMN